MVGSLMHSNVNLLSDYREQVYDGWAPTARQPLLPDRDAIATNAWSQAYSLSITSPLEGEEEERILWPRGLGAYSVHLSDDF
jgi:hypothetical protein